MGNAVWELVQRPLYEHPGPISHCLRAAAGDVAWTVSVAVVAVGWSSRRHGGSFVATLVAGLFVVAVGIEWWALATGRWSYAASMPTVAGLGLAPLVQLPLIGWLAVSLAGRVTARSGQPSGRETPTETPRPRSPQVATSTGAARSGEAGSDDNVER